MITGTHALVYAEDAAATRTFYRDVLGLPYVDSGDGWLIFRMPPAELGVHPADAGATGGRHEVYLLCDDIDATVEVLRERGAEFSGPIADQGFGRLIMIKVPGGGELGLYQPQHATAYDLDV